MLSTDLRRLKKSLPAALLCAFGRRPPADDGHELNARENGSMCMLSSPAALYLMFDLVTSFSFGCGYCRTVIFFMIFAFFYRLI